MAEKPTYEDSEQRDQPGLIPWRMYLLICIVGLIVTGILGYGFFKGNRMNKVYAPLVDAAMEIKLEAAFAHLWFEEIISGDRHEDISVVWKHQDQAEWYAQAMLEGGKSPEGTFISLDDTEMRRKIKNVQGKLSELRKIIQQRIETKRISGIGTDIDQKYDDVFRSFLKEADEVETRLQQIMANDLSSFRYTQVFLIVTSILLFLAVGISFWRFDSQRTKNLRSLNKANKALQDSEENLAITLNSIGDAFISTDTEGNVIQMNPIAEKLTGWNLSEAKGRPLDEVFNIINEKTRKRVENPVEKVLREGLVVGLANHTILISKHGTEYPVEDSGAPIRDKQGEIKGIVLIFRDVSEKRRAEKEIEEKTHLNQTLLDAMPCVAMLIRPSTREIVASNEAARKFGAFPGKTCFETWGQRDEPCSFCLAPRVWETGKAQHMEVGALDIIWDAYWFSIQEDLYLYYAFDITEKRKLEAQLQRSQKMESLGLMAGGIAHDLNNILSGIVSYPDLLLMDLPEDSTLRKPIKTIKDSGMRAADVVSDLLTIARGVATGKEILNLNTLVEEYLDSAEHQNLTIMHSFITFKTDFDNDLLNIICSFTHIRKSLVNLVTNATEAIKGDGTVKISTMNRYLDEPLKGYEEVKAGEYAVLSVSDDGLGISEDDLERIFEPFYTKKVMGRSGTGLGLAVVWNTVQDHNGYINVNTSEKGTTFELYFPVTRDEAIAEKIEFSMKDYIGHGERILVVDDEKLQREIACNLLVRLDYKTEAVSSGEEAVEYLKKQSVDLVVLDMIMPKGINGRETYEKIIKIHPKQKAIIASGFSATIDVKKALSLGAGKYIKKPYTMEKIGLAVKEELEK